VYENIFNDKHVLVPEPKEKVLDVRGRGNLGSDDLRSLLNLGKAENLREEYFIRVVRFDSRWKRYSPVEGWHVAIKGAIYLGAPLASYYKVPAPHRPDLLKLLREIDKFAERDLKLQYAAQGCQRSALPNQSSLESLVELLQRVKFPDAIRAELHSLKTVAAIEATRGAAGQKALRTEWQRQIKAWEECSF
jgi:hypothetical protein